MESDAHLYLFYPIFMMDFDYHTCPLLAYERLTPHGVDKITFHLELEWEGPAFRAGDSIAILPKNNPLAIARLRLRIDLKDLDGKAQEQALQELTENWSIAKLGGKLLRYLAQEKRATKNLEELENSLSDRHLAKSLTEHRDLEDVLIHFGATLAPSHFKEALMPLLPRFYSIASSPLQDPRRLALIVAHVNYYHATQRVGLCSDYLYRLGEGFKPTDQTTLQVAIHPTKDFLLASSDRDIIMIGPGTGIAPFRGYMQQRLATEAKGRSWLFFGERYRNCFFYESLWQACQKKLPFKISCAFSREGKEKIYVQHRMKEHAKELNEWLDHAIIYVCGDANAMAKDVEQAILEILMQERQFDEIAAKAYLKAMRLDGRYLRDVY